MTAAARAIVESLLCGQQCCHVTLETQRLGLIECLRALREVYQTDVDEGLLLRALVYFDDAEREAKLPKEGAKDWDTVKDFFMRRVGALLVPPDRPLAIQARVVDVRDSAPQRAAKRKGKRLRPAHAPSRTARPGLGK